jgi:hypothetical protein
MKLVAALNPREGDAGWGCVLLRKKYTMVPPYSLFSVAVQGALRLRGFTIRINVEPWKYSEQVQFCANMTSACSSQQHVPRLLSSALHHHYRLPSHHPRGT